MLKIFIILILLILLYYCYNNPIINDTFNNIYILPKKIFTYWDDLENNKIIQSHLNTWKRNISKDWEIIIINKKNLHEYVSEDFIKKYKNLNSIRFSDFIRLELLKNNGGVWIDAGIIITNGKFLNDYYDEMVENKYDATIYEFKTRTTNTTYPYLENWFIMTNKNSPFINDLYDEFDKSFNMGFILYKENILIPSKVNLNGTIGYDNRTYLMQHAIINYLYHKGKIYKNNIKLAEESMFKIQNNYSWDNKKVIDFIINNKDWSNYYAIKLTGGNRKYITNDNEYINSINNIN